MSSALPLLSFPSVVSDGARSANASVLATNTTAFIEARHSIVYGKVADSGSQADAGAIIAKVLDIKVGDNLTVDAFSGTQTLTVVGILNSTDQSDTGLILPLSSSWTLWPQTADKISYVEFVAAERRRRIDHLAEHDGDQGGGNRPDSLLLRQPDREPPDELDYVLFALSAAVAVAAALRVVTEVSQEYNTVRALGARLSTARMLVFYQLLVVSGVSVLIGVSAGIVSTSILATLFNPIDNLSLSLTIDPVQALHRGDGRLPAHPRRGVACRCCGCRGRSAEGGRILMSFAQTARILGSKRAVLSLALILLITSAAFTRDVVHPPLGREHRVGDSGRIGQHHSGHARQLEGALPGDPPPRARRRHRVGGGYRDNQPRGLRPVDAVEPACHGARRRPGKVHADSKPGHPGGEPHHAQRHHSGDGGRDPREAA